MHNLPCSYSFLKKDPDSRSRPDTVFNCGCSVLVSLEHSVEHYCRALRAVLHGTEFLLAVGKTVLALYEHHCCWDHVCTELCVVTCAGVDILVLDTGFLSGSLDVSYELLVIVNCVTVPCLDYLAGAA